MPSRSNKTWLIPLLLEVWEKTPPSDDPPFADDAEFEAWLGAELGRRGYHAGLPRDLLHELGDAYCGAGFREFTTVNAEAHRLQIGLLVLRRSAGLVPHAGELDVRHAGMLLFAALGHSVERPGLADQALLALDEELEAVGDPEARSRRRSEIAAALGQAISDRAVAVDDPLLGHPFHEILLYHKAQLFGRLTRVVALARDQPGGRPVEQDLMAPQGRARSAEVISISACIALAVADGGADTDERRLINALLHAARLEQTEVAMLLGELDTPETPEQIAREITDPALRHFVLRLLLLTIHVNGRYEPEERVFFEALASRFGVTEGALQLYELEALQSYEHHARLFGDLSLSRVAGRLRQRLNESLDHALRSNARRLHDEISETGELGQLLLKAGETQLSDEERAKVKSQLLDVVRAIPALAIFAAPGGALLLPLAVKHLPFKILPSNFDKMDEL